MKENRFVNGLLNFSNFIQIVGFILTVFFVGRFFSPVIQTLIYLVGGIISYVYIKLHYFPDKVTDEDLDDITETPTEEQ